MSTTYEHTKGLAQQMSTTIRSAIALLLMMMLGVGELWAATKDFDLPNGYYLLKMRVIILEEMRTSL